MKWDDTPYYARNENSDAQDAKPASTKGTDSTQKSTVKFWSGISSSRSGAPSPLSAWWDYHNPKRLRGEMNEIDTARIEAALRGTFNEWTELVRTNPVLAGEFKNEPTQARWDVIKQFKQVR